MRVIKAVFGLLRRSVEEFSADRVPLLAAALSYYAIFSIAPLLLIAIVIVGAVVGRDVAEAQILQLVRQNVGQEASAMVGTIITGLQHPGATLLATVLGVVGLVLGAAGVFGQIKLALLIIWNVPDKPAPNGWKAIWWFLRDQGIFILLVIGTGLIMLASVIFSAVSSALVNEASVYFSSAGVIWQWVNTLVSFIVLTLIFGAAYRYLPTLKITWRDVLPGAVVTSLLFALGRFLIGLYLGRSSVTSAYGAAGSLVVLLLWVNYTAQIILFGAEFSQVYTVRYGSLRGTAKAAEIVVEKATRTAPTTEAPDPPKPPDPGTAIPPEQVASGKS